MDDFIKDFVQCPICGNEFTYDKVSSTSIKVSSYDLDLKPEYREINVSLYSLITCPNCLFTFQEKDKQNIVDYVNKNDNYIKITQFIEYIKTIYNSEVDNSFEKSDEFYRDQLFIATEIYSILGQTLEVIKIMIKLSWYYREKNDEEKELGILYYCEKLLENEYQNFSKEDDFIFALFYLGYINYRFDRKKEAARYLDYLLKDYKNSSNPYLKAAKNLRGELR